MAKSGYAPTRASTPNSNGGHEQIGRIELPRPAHLLPCSAVRPLSLCEAAGTRGPLNMTARERPWSAQEAQPHLTVGVVLVGVRETPLRQLSAYLSIHPS